MAETLKRLAALALGLWVVLARPNAAATAADSVDEEYAARLRQLIKLLYSPQPETRNTAAAAVRHFGGMAVRPLMDVLKDKNPDARRAALQALSEFGPRARPAVPLVISLLDTKGEDERWWAINTLGRIGPAADRARPLLIEILSQDKSANLRRASARALGRISPSDKAAVDALVTALRDSDENVRHAAVEVLARFKGPDADYYVSALLESLIDKDAYVQAIALEALGEIKPVRPVVVSALVAALANDETYRFAEHALRGFGKDAHPLLLTALEDKNPTLRRRAILSLGQINTALLPAMLKALADSDGDVRASAAHYLARLDEKVKPALASLSSSLNDPDKRVRCKIAWIYLKFACDPQPATAVFLKLLEDPDAAFVVRMVDSLAGAGPRAIPILRKALGHRKPAHAAASVCEFAGDALVRIGLYAAPALTDALNDPDANVRREAVASLRRLARDQAAVERMARDVVPSVGKVLIQDPDRFIRAEAASCLERFASKVTAAVPVLIDALDDPEPIVSKAALRALTAIGPSAKPALPRLIDLVENARAGSPAPEKVRALIDNLDNDSFAVRSTATSELVKLGRAIVAPLHEGIEKSPSLEAGRRLSALLDRLHTQEREYGIASVGALGGIGSSARSAVPLLLTILNDKSRSREMRMGVVGALGLIHPENPAVVAVLTSLLKDKDDGLRQAAAFAFFEMKAPPVGARTALIAALSDPRPISAYGLSLAGAAAKALGDMGPDAADAVPALIDLVKKRKHDAVAAAQALRKVDSAGKKAIPTFIELLQLPDDDIAAIAAESLAHFGPDSRAAIPALIRALVCSNPSTRNSAAAALPRIDPDWEKNAVPILLKELAEVKTLSARSQVIWVLMCRGPLAKDAVPHLLPFLQHPDDDLRLGAVNALAAIGPDAGVAVRRIIPLLKDDSDVICEAAAAALKKIDNKTASR